MYDDTTDDAGQEGQDEITRRIHNMERDGQTQPIIEKPPVTDYLSGAFQNALALGTGYLSRRIDIDLQGRLVGAQPDVRRPSNQRPVSDHADLTTRGVALAGGTRLGDLLPWAAAAAVAWLVFGPKRA